MSYGNKPNEIKHSKVALRVEEYVAERVQSLGYTADLNSEDVYQLTDANIVEVVDSDPSVSITIDVNDFGSINFWNELGGYNKTRDNDVTNTNSASGLVSLLSISDNPIDFMVSVYETSSNTEPTRSAWFSNCFLDSISATYQVDGFATESFSFSGTSQEWFLNAWGAAEVVKGEYLTTTTLDFTMTDGTARVLTEDGVKVADTLWTEAAGTVTAQGAKTFSSSSRYRLVGTKTDPLSSVPIASSAAVGGIKEGEIEILVWDDDAYPLDPDVGVDGTAYQKLLRAQSVDYELSFDREDLKQLYTGAYYKGLNTTTITSTITVLDSDLELWATLAGYSSEYLSGGSEAVVQMALSDFQSTTNLALRVDIFNTKDYLAHAQATLLKQVTLTGGKVTSVADSYDVPGRGTQTFEVTFTSMSVEGTGRSGR